MSLLSTILTGVHINSSELVFLAEKLLHKKEEQTASVFKTPLSSVSILMKVLLHVTILWSLRR